MIFVPFTNGKMFVAIVVCSAAESTTCGFILSQKSYQSKRNVLRMIEEYIAIRKTSVYVGACIMPIK